MKNTVLWAVVVFTLITSGCNEIPPTIDFSEPIKLIRDTTYIKPVTTTKPLQNVLIEDISGVQCNNCPSAAEAAHKIQDKNPGRVVILTEHPLPSRFGFFVKPRSNSLDSFNTQEAHDIALNLIQDVDGLPKGAINRKIFDGEDKVALPHSSWEVHANTELQTSSDVELSVNIEKLSDRRFAVNTSAFFFEKQAKPVYISVFLTESEIVSTQKILDNTYNDDYVHNNILRLGLTTYSGQRLAESIEVGRVFEKGFTLDVPERFKLENCSVVILINRVDSESREVLQCTEASLP